MEITLSDLLTMEPRLIPAQELAFAPAGSAGHGDIPVSWAVTARTTVPHLPLLRGGEVLLIPPRATTAVGDDLPALIREGAARGVSGVVFADDDALAGRTYPKSNDVRFLLWRHPLTADAETDINRLLTEWRGNLYRIGTELERHMADVTATQSGLGVLVRVVAATTGLHMIVKDARRRPLVSTLVHPDPSDFAKAGATRNGGNPGACSRGLMRGATLVLQPEKPEQRIVARFLIDRIAIAANAALLRDDAARPRGLQRAAATAILLSGSGSASDQRARALALGLDPDTVFFVAVSDAEIGSVVDRALAPLGTVYPAGTANERWVTLVAAAGPATSESFSGRIRDVTARWEREPGTMEHSLALSGPAFGIASLRRAVMEAEFVATMQSVGDVTRRAASFGSVDDLGAMGLLYHLRDSAELRRFIVEALGTLPTGDQRGTLRATLRAFLESGGSHVEAAHRLGIHRNTLSYRLRRIGELVGRDVADPATWLTLHLALRAAAMLEVFTERR